MHFLTKFFLICSGSERSVLSETKTEVTKHVGVGATVFFTGVFAAISCGYALYTVFDNVIIASFFGLLWGMMIFNLDRYIVSSMRKEARGWREFLVALPRIILALFISIVIVKPLELKIFEKEIKPELVLMEQEKFAAQENTLSLRFNNIQDSLKREISSLETEVMAYATKRDELVKLAQEEADGTGGSRKKNLGPIYKVKKADADRAEAELANIQNLNRQKAKSLRDLADANDLQRRQEIAVLSKDPIDGPAARIEALDRLADQSSAIWWAHWFIVLLFIAIETAPVFVKLMSSKGPYDNLLKIEENSFFVRETETLAKHHAEAKERSKTFSEHERTFLNDRLDTSLKRS
jgi:hypothetical protein